MTADQEKFPVVGPEITANGLAVSHGLQGRTSRALFRAQYPDFRARGPDKSSPVGSGSPAGRFFLRKTSKVSMENG